MSQLEFPFQQPPPVGGRIEVQPGFDWIRQDLPFALDHVNCWLAHDSAQSCLIDTGVFLPDSVNSMQQAVADVGLPQTLCITHFHPDHAGMAGWFARQGVSVIGHRVEMEVVHRLTSISDSEYGQFYADWYRKNGIDEAAVAHTLSRGNSYRKLVAEPPSECAYLDAGETLSLGGRLFDVHIGEGHAPAMLMFHSAESQLLIAADQLLPSISPNVSLMPNAIDDDPLNSFITSLHRLRELPADTLVLPSHGLPFYGLHERVDDLLAHHELRCEQILEACHKPQSACELFKVLFKRELDAQQLSFALGESLAHTRYLCRKGAMFELADGPVVHFQTNPS